MENLHVHLLQKLCRLCKQTIVLKHGYKTAKTVEEFTNPIYAIYDIDVDVEDFDVFPKSLCGSCVRKIQRTEKKQPPVHFKPPLFVSHSNNCSICVTTPPFTGLHIKQVDIEMLQNGFFKATENQTNFKRIYVRSSVENERLVNEMTVFIHNDNSWHCNVHNKTVKNEIEYLKDLPKVLSDSNIKMFSAKFRELNVCKSISGFSDVIQARLDIKQPFRDIKGHDIVGIIEDDLHNPLIKENFVNVRHSSCLLLSIENLCGSCANYTKFLRSCKSRIGAGEPERKKARISDTSKTNYRFLSRDELEERLANTQKQKKEAIKKVNRLSKIVGDFIKNDGVVLEGNNHDVFKTIVNNEDIEFDEETPQGLLWQQQKEQLNKKDSRGMRWHPLIIRWCLSIYYSSPKAYNQMSSKRLNFLRLPHINTLKKYTQFTKATSGFNPDIIQRLIEESGVSSLPDWKKNVSLCYDEMQIKSNLVYKKSTGQMIGFTEMGDVNEEFRSFKENVESVDNETSSSDSVHLDRSFATHVIVYMARGIFTGLAYPFGYFASTGFSAAQLYPCTMEATRVLTAIGFRVCTYVSDGASPNRKFYKIILANDDDDNIFWSWNPHDYLFKIYCISDVPHLVKTTRNCLENSNWNKNTRNLHLDGQDITWKMIIDVYEWDLGIHRGAPGLRKLHKIKEEHIKLAPRMRMQVRLATQVLSETVAQALEMQGLHNTKSIINFVRIINRVFDCLNVSNRKESNLGRPELQPYKNPTDWRFKFLEEDFLTNFLNRWEAAANATVGMTQEEKNRLLLSKQTQHGWKMTVKSFAAIAKDLLLEDGSRFILSEKFTQDPLEEHFAKQRLRGGCNDNPDLSQFGNQELVLNVMSSGLIKELRGNTRGANRNEQALDVHDMRQLPKKKMR